LNCTHIAGQITGRRNRGFSLLELMVAMVILLSVAGIVMSGLMQTAWTEGMVANRTEMHASVRSATELLQQEIGQAGAVALPAAVTLSAAVTTTGSSSSVAVSSTTGMFANELLLVDTGVNQETVTVTAVSSSTITAIFSNTHASGVPVTLPGGFGTGIVPPTANGMTNGSTGSLLKLYGDVNNDGNMQYVEYTCDTAGGNLYRNAMSFSASSKPALTSAMVLLPNIQSNPSGTACFTYQVKPTGCSGSSCFVTDVAVTLTVQTQQKDPQTGQYQTETKALLNVSPRNVFDTWELNSASVTNRIQPMPASVTSLLP